MQNRSSWIVVAVLIVIVAGCGDGGAGKEILMKKACLSKLAMAYHGFYAKNGKSPANVEELTGYLQETSAEDEVTGEAIKRLRAGDFVFIYDGVLGDGAVNDQYLLGFESSVPGSGGYMVTGGCFVDHVTAREFSQMTEIPTGE